MKIAWIMGWATPRDWFAAQVEVTFPQDQHLLIEAGPEMWEELERSGPLDALAGYSLGSLLLLENPERAARQAERIALFAPIFAFPKEAGLGGKIARAQVVYLAKWLRRDPSAALADFSLRAELYLPRQSLDERTQARLEWGLKRLETDRVTPPAPRGWQLYGGTGDSLLDAEALRKIVPDLTLVEGATHHPLRLLTAWADSIRPVVPGGNGRAEPETLIKFDRG